jgi:hypothetical protein
LLLQLSEKAKMLNVCQEFRVLVLSPRSVLMKLAWFCVGVKVGVRGISHVLVAHLSRCTPRSLLIVCVVEWIIRLGANTCLAPQCLTHARARLAEFDTHSLAHLHQEIIIL